MDLTNVSSGVAKRKLKRRVGRGIGSGQGKTAGLGHKGQYQSAGARLPGGLFEGGQMPLYRRFPKRGFNNAAFQKDWAVVNVGDLDQYPAGLTVDMALLKATSAQLTDEQAKGLTKEQQEKRAAGKGYFRRLVSGTFDGVRVLGDGELGKKLTVRASHFSKGRRRRSRRPAGPPRWSPGRSRRPGTR